MFTSSKVYIGLQDPKKRRYQFPLNLKSAKLTFLRALKMSEMNYLMLLKAQNHLTL